MRSFFFLASGLALGTLAACGSTLDATGGAGGSATTGGVTTGSVTTGAGGAVTATVATGTGTGTTTASSTGAGGGQPCADPPAPQVFEIGTGEGCFERLMPGQTVPVLQGPQGGYHIWLAVGCADCGAQATLQYGVKDPATMDWFAGTGMLKQVVDLTPGSWHQRAGVTAFLPGVPSTPMSELPKGTHVLLSAAILDKNMQPVHQGEIELVLGDTQMWSPPCDPGPDCGAPGGLPCCNDSFP